MAVIRILLADDHDLVRAGIGRMLDDVADMTVIGHATSGEEAVLRSRELQPDVVLMDIRMPGIGGLEATRKIVARDANIKVIALSAWDDDPLPARLLQAGASGYVAKDAPFEEVVKAIRKVMAGQRYLSANVAEQMALKRFDNSETSPFERLSERELQIALMVVNCEKVQDISDKLNLSPKTVNSYRYRLFEKLEISSDVELTHLAIKYHMVDRDPE
ncbi:MAG TPA: UvrY/SirA/GacA family response regulator transcription factor [Spongiibacteraceae bacterium]|nr:UvrY/SirA/GacA family response regulator transcription factor [Spongiibacteraceae bacterium]